VIYPEYNRYLILLLSRVPISLSRIGTSTFDWVNRTFLVDRPFSHPSWCFYVVPSKVSDQVGTRPSRRGGIGGTLSRRRCLRLFLPLLPRCHRRTPAGKARPVDGGGGAASSRGGLSPAGSLLGDRRLSPDGDLMATKSGSWGGGLGL